MEMGRLIYKNGKEVGFFPRRPVAVRGEGGRRLLLRTDCIPDVAEGDCYQNF